MELSSSSAQPLCLMAGDLIDAVDGAESAASARRPVPTVEQPYPSSDRCTGTGVASVLDACWTESGWPEVLRTVGPAVPLVPVTGALFVVLGWFPGQRSMAASRTPPDVPYRRTPRPDRNNRMDWRTSGNRRPRIVQ